MEAEDPLESTLKEAGMGSQRQGREAGSLRKP